MKIGVKRDDLYANPKPLFLETLQLMLFAVKRLMFPDMKPNEAVNEIKFELEDLIDQMRFQLIQPFRARFDINSLLTSGDFNQLLLTFASRLVFFLA